jgi:hypothetical protein
MCTICMFALMTVFNVKSILKIKGLDNVMSLSSEYSEGYLDEEERNRMNESKTKVQTLDTFPLNHSLERCRR